MRTGKVVNKFDWSLDDYFDELREIEYENKQDSDSITNGSSSKYYSEAKYSFSREVGAI